MKGQPRYYMTTFTGQKFDLLRPDPDKIHIADIAHSLSLICRWGGHIDRFYSVAEHCLLMVKFGDPELKLHLLLHDATETYLGDMISPLKQSMPEYRQAESRIWKAVCTRFDLRPTELDYERVKASDNRARETERRWLMSKKRSRNLCIEGVFEPFPTMLLKSDPPHEVEKKFRRIFNSLTRQ